MGYLSPFQSAHSCATHHPNQERKTEQSAKHAQATSKHFQATYTRTQEVNTRNECLAWTPEEIGFTLTKNAAK